MAFISICIPTYKNIDFLKRLWKSIASQTFNDFEVIITDDSPDDSVQLFINQLQTDIPIQYFKNEIPLGTPKNWNECIKRASGEWIKLIHDDDWFANADALLTFKEYIDHYPGISFFYCAYNNVNQESNKVTEIKSSKTNDYLIKRNPLSLLRKNTIGNPSCVLNRKNGVTQYDERLKWIVDIEFYIRWILKYKVSKYIPDVLINVGINDEQVTNYSFRNPAIEIPENFIFLEKYGPGILKKIVVFDYYWRLLRNLKIKSENDLVKYYSSFIPDPAINGMIQFQQKISFKLLGNGFISKTCMFIEYWRYLFTRK